MIQPVKRRRAAPRKSARTSISTDIGGEPSKTDPLQRRLTGIAPHGNTPFDVPVISEIAPRLYQGGTLNGLIMPRFMDHVVTLYTAQGYTYTKDVKSTLTFKLEDKENQDLSHIDTIARWINECRRSGNVFVHCSAGLNRSSLVVARALMLEGMSALDAIASIRQKRSPACLCNKAFEVWLLAFE